MPERQPTFGDILAARRRLGTLACRTPLIEHPALNARVGGRVLLKAENLQRVGAFKFRGAYNKVAQVDKATFPGGVVACSSGNHAQGVAAAATLMGFKSVDRDAGRCATPQDRAHARVRRRGGGLRPRQGGPRRHRSRPLHDAAGGLRPSLRRPRRHRRPGHRGPRDDGAGRGDRRHPRHRAGRRLRRRAHQRRVDRGQGEEPGDGDLLGGARRLRRSRPLAQRAARARGTPGSPARSAMRCWRRRRASSPSRWRNAIWPAAFPSRTRRPRPPCATPSRS